MAKTKMYRPIKVRRNRLDKINGLRFAALREATRGIGHVADETIIRIETYSMRDIRHLVTKVWRWSIDLDELSCPKDQRRVRIIMDIAPKEGWWPYVSFRADTIEELADVVYEEDEPDDPSVPNHGDGWHRMVASHEMQRRTFDIMFVEGPIEKRNPYLR